MHRIPAGPRRRTRRALLAAALPAVLAAVALPSAAQAATATVSGSLVQYSAAAGETNQVFVRVIDSKLVISDNTAPITARDGCTLNSNSGDAECPITAFAVNMHLGDQNDRVEYAAPHQGFVDAGFGQDTFMAGLRRAAPGRAIEPVFYNGGPNTDTVDYRFADRGVRVDTADNPVRKPDLATDGRPGDRESVQEDVENIRGTAFADVLLGSAANNLIEGRNGDDAIGGGLGADVIDEGSFANGADTLNGGDGSGDVINYGNRTSGGVNVSLDGVRNDGAPGEGDDVRPSVENIQGSNFVDTLIGNELANTIDALSGNDRIEGRSGNDTLFGHTGTDTILGESGNDTLQARDFEGDVVGCGENPNDFDTAFLDSLDGHSGCEDPRTVAVGTLRLAPKALQATAGERTQLRLSWRHPRGWRELRTIELRLTDDGLPVGEVTIRPRGERVADDGAVSVQRARIATRGKTVIAKLALRLDQSLAGQTLKADVEATDRRGARQLERAAGTVRVAR